MKSLTQFIEKNKRIIPLNGKIPITENWVNSKFDLETLQKHKGNFGWALDKCDLVIDVDPRNDGKKSFDKLYQKLKEYDINLDFRASVFTPSKGFHIYLSLPQNFTSKIKKNHKEYPGIDFLSYSCQCVIPESETDIGRYTWADEIFCEFIQLSAPKLLLDIIKYDNIDNNSDLGDFEGIISSTSIDITFEEIKSLLDKLDPSMGYEDWIKVGMALHDWNKDEGLAIWEKWSKLGDNYKEGETDKHYKSFKPGKGIGIGTLKHLVKEANKQVYKIEIEDTITNIKTATKDSIEDIISKIPNWDIDDFDREILVKEVQNRYKDLLGIKIPVIEIRKKLAHSKERNCETPDWCKNWIYVNSHTSFINIKTMKAHKTESFNIENGKYIPENESGSKLNATKFISDNGYITKVDNLAYLPSYAHHIVEIDNQKVLNTFNHTTIPLTDEDYTDEGLIAIEKIKTHIKLICATEENSKIFTEWLAHQIQFPGRQILWSPVIQAIQGVGKSFFGELLRHCLGDRNVGTVSPTQVVSQFNGWATGIAVNVLEELRVVGHNRFEAINALKPLITDRMIQINDKGLKQYTTYNTTNYICFTNYKDALPIDEDDRRWWVIFVEIRSLQEIKELTGIEHVTYFMELFDALRNNPGQIRKWLLEYEISKEFIKIKQAPMTNYKRSMILTEEASIEGLDEIKELLTKGGKYYNLEALDSSELFEELTISYPEILLTNHKKNQLLKRLGYIIHPSKVNYEGKNRRIWTKYTMSKENIIECFKK